MESSTLLLVIVGIAIVGFTIFVYLRDQQEKGELRERGVTVTAHVTGRNREVTFDTDPNTNSTTSSETYYVSYTYTVNGQTYSKRDHVSRETFDILQ